jgi:hypothetical protein
MTIFGRAVDSQLLSSSSTSRSVIGSIGLSSSLSSNDASNNGTDASSRHAGCSGKRWTSGLSALFVAVVTLLSMTMRNDIGRIPVSTMIVTSEYGNNGSVSKTLNDALQMTSSSCGREHHSISSPVLALHQPLLLQRQLQDSSNTCDDSNEYTSTTLKLVYELPFASLYENAKGQRRFDASSLVLVGDYAYTIYDNSFAIGKVVVPQLQPFSNANTQITRLLATSGGNDSSFADDDDVKDSRFEAILHNNATGNFFAIQDSVVEDQNNVTVFHAMFVELSMNSNETEYEVVESCPSEFTFLDKSLGISGAVALRDTNDTFTVLALCSVNHCDNVNGNKDDKGNGRIIVMTYMPAADDAADSSSCQWKTVRVVNIPATANFSDYSDLAMTATGRVAVTSRTESAVWIGQLLGQEQEDGGQWQVLDMAFDEDVGDVHNFPRGNDCEKVYCSVDGVEWLNDDVLLMVSDKMRDEDNFFCLDTDQSMHVFAFPEEHDESDDDTADDDGMTDDGPPLVPSSNPGAASSPSSAAADVRNQRTLSGRICLFCIILFYTVPLFVE